MHTHGEEDDARKKFELPGSRPHYPPSLSFTVTHMRLAIEPDLQKRSISCEQKLSITILHDTDVIELDAAELQIKSLTAGSKLDFRGLEDRLAVKLGAKGSIS
jgi:aminopeptidase N